MYANLFLALNYRIGGIITAPISSTHSLTDVAAEEVLSVFMRICTGVVIL